MHNLLLLKLSFSGLSAHRCLVSQLQPLRVIIRIIFFLHIRGGRFVKHHVIANSVTTSVEIFASYKIIKLVIGLMILLVLYIRWILSNERTYCKV